LTGSKRSNEDFQRMGAATSGPGRGTHGNCDYNLEIHVPQAFAADVLLVSFGAEKPQSWINDRVAFSATAAIAMDRGQFANVPPEVRQWFEHLRSPAGMLCCSYADGHRTGYDMRQDQYWVPIEGEWYPVPPEAVIKTANPVGEAIVWYQSVSTSEYNMVISTDPKYRIICFVPTDGV
jgi:hypothetical protein